MAWLGLDHLQVALTAELHRICRALDGGDGRLGGGGRRKRAAQARGTAWKLVVISSPIQEIGRASEVGIEAIGSENEIWADDLHALGRHLDERV